MGEPKLSGDSAAAPADEEQSIRKRVRELTSQVLQYGRVDTEAVRDVVRAVTSAPGSASSGADAGEALADSIRVLNEAVQKSAAATHEALQRLASRGNDFTDNDLKDALVSLRALEEAYVAAANRISEAMTGNLRREMMGLATHAQGIGAEASARIAGLMSEFANRLGSPASGLETMRGAGVRMALLASGILAGIADALHGRSDTKSDQ
jgi:thioesterase domain-containing protein